MKENFFKLLYLIIILMIVIPVYWIGHIYKDTTLRVISIILFLLFLKLYSQILNFLKKIIL